jgi:hypothetical protein
VKEGSGEEALESDYWMIIVIVQMCWRRKTGIERYAFASARSDRARSRLVWGYQVKGFGSRELRDRSGGDFLVFGINTDRAEHKGENMNIPIGCRHVA